VDAAVTVVKGAARLPVILPASIGHAGGVATARRPPSNSLI